MTKQLILPGRRSPEYSHPYRDRELIAKQRPRYTRKTIFLTMFRNLSSGLDHDGTELTPGSRLNALMAYDTAFEGHHRETDISLARRARTLSRTDISPPNMAPSTTK
jgi:hypothetical protein